MDKKTEKLTNAILEAAAELLKASGYVKMRGLWVSADDLKAAARK